MHKSRRGEFFPLSEAGVEPTTFRLLADSLPTWALWWLRLQVIYTMFASPEHRCNLFSLEQLYVT